MASQDVPVPPDHIMGVYNRAPLAFARGEGVRLYTDDGEEYLGCVAGIAAIAVYAYGVYDGLRHYRRRPALVVTPPPSGEGAMLGLAGRF